MDHPFHIHTFPYPQDPYPQAKNKPNAFPNTHLFPKTIPPQTQFKLMPNTTNNRYHPQSTTPKTTNHQHKDVPMLKYLQICALTAFLLSGCQSTKTTAETSVKTIFDPYKQEVCGPIHLEWKVKKEW